MLLSKLWFGQVLVLLDQKIDQKKINLELQHALLPNGWQEPRLLGLLMHEIVMPDSCQLRQPFLHSLPQQKIEIFENTKNVWTVMKKMFALKKS